MSSPLKIVHAGGLLVEFCPKCGGVLIPQEVGRARKLVCQHCGREARPKKRTAYKIREKGKEREEITVVIEKRKRKPRKPIEREYELEPPEYYEEFFES
jgi:DNA-directed RNA polymerase subunit M